MKYIREFENFDSKPVKVVDYVICDDMISDITGLESFISNNIGQLILIDQAYIDKLNSGIERTEGDEYAYHVKYDNFPKNYHEFCISGTDNTISFAEDEIIYWSENKEDMEDILLANKYNL